MGDKVKFPLFNGQVDFEMVFDHDKNDAPILVVNAYSERQFLENLKPADINQAHTLRIPKSRRSTTPKTLKDQAKEAGDIKRKLSRSPTYLNAKHRFAPIANPIGRPQE